MDTFRMKTYHVTAGWQQFYLAAVEIEQIGRTRVKIALWNEKHKRVDYKTVSRTSLMQRQQPSIIDNQV